MKIVLSGVETNNKGAELMLYAILQEIERRYPDAVVYIPKNRINQGLSYIKTKLDFRLTPFEAFEQKLYLAPIFARLKMSFRILPHMVALGRVDYFIDGSGFRFSDQFKFSNHYDAILQGQLSAFRKKGAKIIYLPQAFGPFEKKQSKAALTVLNKYVTVLMPREKVSLNYISESGVFDMEKVRMFTDFTSLVEGIFPVQYEHLRNGICIIPNSQMINKGAISMDAYLEMLRLVFSISSSTGRKVYMLNHAGWQDKELCNSIRQLVTNDIETVTDLNALEVKGLISSAYLVITSRFHGLASALNSCVPALSTSWSHKYEELYRDYALESYVLPLNDNTKAVEGIRKLLDTGENVRIREHLKKHVPLVKEQTRAMWNTIWNM